MSIKEEMTTVESPGKSISIAERLKSLSVRWKIRIAYLGRDHSYGLPGHRYGEHCFSAKRLFIMPMTRYTFCGALKQNLWRRGLNDCRIK